MRPDLVSLRRYGPSDLVELARLWAILAYVDARLGLMPTSWNRRWLFREEAAGDPGRRVNPGPKTLSRISSLLPLLRIAARFRLRRGSPCLCLALALRARLDAFGQRTALVYGARRRMAPGRAIEAHAWLQLGATRLDPFESSAGFIEFEGRGRR
jgi:hypothetical protein